jgi:polysaccharide pyruvyl transferase WcaK-like protein
MDGKRPVIRKISLFGNFGTLNIGNECTLQAILHNIRRFLPEADVQCICSIPEDVQARHQIPAFPMSRRSTRMSPATSARGPGQALGRLLRRIFLRVPGELSELARMRRILKGRDRLIMTGTGMLADGGEGSLGLPYEIFKWTMMARLCGLRVLFVSVGVEPIRHRLTRWLVKLSLGRADHICFRDRQSQDSMTRMGFHRSSIVFPDLAFSLPEPILEPFGGTPAGRPVVGVGLYDYCGRGSGPGTAGQRAYGDYLAKIADFVEWLVTGGYPVRILVGDISYDTAVRTDLRGTLLARGLAYDEKGIVDEPVGSVPDLLDQIQSTDIVVASRFHNVILSLLLAKPVISISYNTKNDAVMADTGLPEYCLRIADFEVAGLIEKFKAIEGRRRDVPARIRTKTREFRAALDVQYRQIFTIRGE